MRNIKIILEYDGTHYCGWQRQARQRRTIQEILEKTLRRILGSPVQIVGSGRTDAGVHAIGQVANFATGSDIPVLKLRLALNALLPDDIAVRKVEDTEKDFHAIYSAQAKRYRYLIFNRSHRSALLKNRAYFCHAPLNISLMRQEVRCLIGKHDFKAFCSSSSNAKTTIRCVKNVSIRKMAWGAFTARGKGSPHKVIAIDVEADGFLYTMVRNIVGTLIDIGRGRLPKGSMRRILMSKDRKQAGVAAAACGLYLLEVKY